MRSERDRRVEELFIDAMDLPEEEREAFLLAACPDDEALRAEVATLLAHDLQVKGEFLEHPVHFSSEEAAPSLPLTQIGPYRIVRRISAGGMGVVYEAEQENPRRSVAVKVVRMDRASSAILRRFRHESEVLGRLQHPGIAHIYEAGVTTLRDAAGGEMEQPYIAMELIRGKPLTEYAIDEGLSTRLRMELAASVCDAVQYAHEKGVVHRDLKPANILVDDLGKAKVMDFGIARVTDSDLKTSLRTNVGQLLGTVAYMSSEQIEGDPEKIDGRSDIYTLGVLLFELLAGRLPHEVNALPIAEAARTIQVDDPPRISQVVPSLRGDVATIVHKALEKERQRRYPSAAALAEDIRRYLADEPILARPTSSAYQIRKFARRNKPLVGGFLVATLALVVGSVLAISQAVRATKEARRANDAAFDAKEQKELAIHRLREMERAQEESEAAVGFLTKMLTSVDPEILGRDVLVRDVLDLASEEVDRSWADRPGIQARLSSAIGQAYEAIGLYTAADPHLEKARELHLRLLGPEHETTQGATIALACLKTDLGDYSTAERLQKELLGILVTTKGAGHEMTLSVRIDLGETYSIAQRHHEAEEIFRDVVGIAERTLPADAQLKLTAQSGLSLVLSNLGRLDESETLLLQVIEALRSSRASEDLDVLSAKGQLAALRGEQGRFAEAEKHFREILEVRDRVQGEAHPQTLGAMNNLATSLSYQGRDGQAEKLYLEVLRLASVSIGDDHRQTITARQNLAQSYMRQGRLKEGKALIEDAISALLRTPLETPVSLASALNVLGSIHFHSVEPDLAERAWGKALEIVEVELPSDHPFRNVLRVNHADCLTLLGRYPEAERELLAAHESFLAKFGPEHRNPRMALSRLVDCYRAWGKTAEAERVVTDLNQATR